MRVRWDKYFPLLILLLGLLAYASSFQGSFVLDDSRTIIENPRIRHLLPHGEEGWFEPRCFAKITFALNYAAGRLNPADYHFTNLIIHLLAALLLYGGVKRTLLLPRMADMFGNHAKEVAFFSAAIWVVHPLTTSSVTYISQRYEILMGMFYLLTLYCMIRGATGQRSLVIGHWSLIIGHWFWYAASILACGLGMAAKEVIMTAPIVVLFYDRIFLSRSFKEAFQRRWALYAGFAAICGLVSLPAIAWAPQLSNLGPAQNEGLSISYCLTQCGVISHYLRLVFWPHPLCIDYAWPMVEHLSDVLPSLIFMCMLGLATLAALRYWPAMGFLGLSFFIILSPTSSVIPLPDAAFEHRMYLPLAAVVTGTVAGIYRVLMRLLKRSSLQYCQAILSRGIPAIIIVALALATHYRNRVYCCEETIWRDVIANRPQNIRAYINMASCLYLAGRYNEAIDYCEQALTRLPDFEKMDHAAILRSKDKSGAEDLSLKVFNYAQIRNSLGLAYQAQGSHKKALSQFTEAIRLTPGNLRAQNNLAITLFELGRTNEAIMHWKHILLTNPDIMEVHRCLAEALASRGDIKDAVKHYNAVLELRPDEALVQSRLAWIHATSPVDSLRDGEKAVALASTAAKAVGYKSSRVLDILAAAYAEQGEFEEAAKTAQKAIQLAERESFAFEIEKRLELYLKRMPYRELDPFERTFK